MGLALFLLCVLVIANLEADADATAIAAQKSINHGDKLIERALCCLGCGALIAVSFHQVEWRTLLWIPAGAGLLSASFRWMLNRMRGKDWRYISPSSWYDGLFIQIAFRDKPRHDVRPMTRAHDRIYSNRFDNAEVVRPNRANLWVNVNWYRDRIHRAGSLAYAFEGIILLASIILYKWAA